MDSMQQSQLLQPSFAAGELDPLIIGRIDHAKYKVGLATCENFLPMISGGIKKMSPTVWIGTGGERLIPFQKNDGTALLLNISSTGVISFYKLSSLFNYPSFDTSTIVAHDFDDTALWLWVNSAHDPNEYYLTYVPGGAPPFMQPTGVYHSEFGWYPGNDPYAKGTAGALLLSRQWGWGDADSLGYNTIYIYPDALYGSKNFVAQVMYQGPWTGNDIYSINYVQHDNTLYFTHQNYVPYSLTFENLGSGYAENNSIWSLKPCSFEPKTGAPTGLTATPNGGSSSGTLTTLQYAVAAVGLDGGESLICDPITKDIRVPWESGFFYDLAWNSITDAIAYRVYKNTRGDWGLMGEVTQNFVTLPSVTPVSGGDGGGHVKALAFDGDITTYWASTQVGGGPVLGHAYIGQDYGAGNTKYVTKFRILQGINQNDTSDCLTSMKLEHSPDGTTWTTLQTFTITAMPNQWQEWEISAAPSAYRFWRLLANSEPTTGIPWRVVEVEFQYIVLPVTFRDDYVQENTAYGPMNLKNPFVGTGNYPACCAIWKQRLWFANTVNQPQTVWATKIGILDDMSDSYPLQPDDGIEATYASALRDSIQAMVPLRDLLLFTENSVLEIPNEIGGGAFSATNFEFRVNSSDGISCNNSSSLTGIRNNTVVPTIVGTQVIFLTKDATAMRSANYDLVTDNYMGKDLTVLAKHVFRDYGQPANICFAQGATPVIIGQGSLTPGAGRTFNSLWTCVYFPEQEVFAFARHPWNTAAEVTSMCVLSQRGKQYVAFVRGGNIQYWTEDSNSKVMNVNCFPCYYVAGYGYKSMPIYIDTWMYCFRVSVGGSTMTTNIGFANMTLRCFYATSNTFANLSVDNYFDTVANASGVVTIPAAYSAYNAFIVGVVKAYKATTLPIETEGNTGKTVRPLQKKVNKVYVKVYNTKGGFISPDGGTHTAALCGTTAAITDLVEIQLPQIWNKPLQITITSNDHYPMTILDIEPEVTFGG